MSDRTASLPRLTTTTVSGTAQGKLLSLDPLASILDWLGNNWFGVVGVLVGLVGVWIAYKPKRLDYSIAEVSQIGHPSMDSEGVPIAVTYGGAAVNEPFLSAVRFKNTGGKAIREDDFAGEWKLHTGAKLLGMRVRDTNIDADIPYGRYENEQAVTLYGLLMNPKDWFEVEMITDGVPQLQVSARIAGAKVRRSGELMNVTLAVAGRIMAMALLSLLEVRPPQKHSADEAAEKSSQG